MKVVDVVLAVCGYSNKLFIDKGARNRGKNSESIKMKEKEAK